MLAGSWLYNSQAAHQAFHVGSAAAAHLGEMCHPYLWTDDPSVRTKSRAADVDGFVRGACRGGRIDSGFPAVLFALSVPSLQCPVGYSQGPSFSRIPDATDKSSGAYHRGDARAGGYRPLRGASVGIGSLCNGNIDLDQCTIGLRRLCTDRRLVLLYAASF